MISNNMKMTLYKINSPNTIVEPTNDTTARCRSTALAFRQDRRPLGHPDRQVKLIQVQNVVAG